VATEKAQTFESLTRVLEPSSGSKPVVALGGFALIHAGTVDFLEAAAKEGDRLFVGILSDASNLRADVRDADALLTPDERQRILSAMSMTDGAAIVEEPQRLEFWAAAGAQIRWVCDAIEQDVGELTVAQCKALDIQLQTVARQSTVVTTADILKRIKHGSAPLGAT
jgi:glycerol-3-phosphate cytidylyltransferase-like family protein